MRAIRGLKAGLGAGLGAAGAVAGAAGRGVVGAAKVPGKMVMAGARKLGIAREAAENAKKNSKEAVAASNQLKEAVKSNNSSSIQTGINNVIQAATSAVSNNNIAQQEAEKVLGKQSVQTNLPLNAAKKAVETAQNNMTNALNTNNPTAVAEEGANLANAAANAASLAAQEVAKVEANPIGNGNPKPGNLNNGNPKPGNGTGENLNNRIANSKKIIETIISGNFNLSNDKDLLEKTWSCASEEKRNNIKRIGKEIATIKNKNTAKFGEYMNAKIFNNTNGKNFTQYLKNSFTKAANAFKLTPSTTQNTLNNVPKNNKILNNIPTGNILVQKLTEFINANNNKGRFVRNGKNATNKDFEKFKKLGEFQNISRKDLIEFILKISVCIEVTPASEPQGNNKLESGNILELLALRILKNSFKVPKNENGLGQMGAEVAGVNAPAGV